MSISVRFCAAFTGLLLASAASAQAQRQAPYPYEIGVDGTIARRSYDRGPDVTTVSLPVNTLRVGLFVTNQIELEPSLSFQRITVGDGDDRSQIDFSVAAPIYFTPERTKPQFFLRPVVGLFHVSDPGGTQLNVGAGLGVKLPIDSRISTRLEAEYRHGNGSDDFAAYNQFGLIVGLSVYTR
jgi:outer membrane protein with beta-barrel domain